MCEKVSQIHGELYIGYVVGKSATAPQQVHAIISLPDNHLVFA